MADSGDRESVAINYVARHPERPRYYANDHSKDTVVVETHAMPVFDGRAAGPGLDDAGFMLVRHAASNLDFSDRKAAMAAHAPEIEDLLLKLTGADAVVVTGAPILRFSERSGRAGSSDNSYPARFAHVDLSNATGRSFSARSAGDRPFARAAHYNVWRALSGAPQDVPLAICDARSLSGREMIAADAIFDAPDGNEWQFEGWLVAHDPTHRWYWFPDMTPDEAIVFKTHDSRPDVAQCVPHVAFDDPACPVEAAARVSVEMRAIAYWWA